MNDAACREQKSRVESDEGQESVNKVFACPVVWRTSAQVCLPGPRFVCTSNCHTLSALSSTSEVHAGKGDRRWTWAWVPWMPLSCFWSLAWLSLSVSPSAAEAGAR